MPEVVEENALDQQLSLFEQQVGQLTAGATSIGYADADTVSGLGLAIFQQIRRLESHLIPRDSNRISSIEIERARLLAGRYARWYRSAMEMRKVIKAYVSQGYAVQSADELNQACQHARLPALHFDQLLELQVQKS
jgi:hypothetical protein